jgi:hypothetical protein
MALTAKAGVTNDEIVGAYVIKRTKLHNGLLDVQNSRLDVQKKRSDGCVAPTLTLWRRSSLRIELFQYFVSSSAARLLPMPLA